MSESTEPPSPVKIRLRWNAPERVEIAADAIWGLHFRNEAGGVCTASPRAFLAGQVWCDKFDARALGHYCREGPPPHELRVYVLPGDNTPQAYALLRARLRR